MKPRLLLFDLLCITAILIMPVSAEWERVTDSSDWSGRYLSTAVTMHNGDIILMGGDDGGFVNDVWKSSDEGATWNPQTLKSSWSIREHSVAVVEPDNSIILIGGYSTGLGYNDVWKSTDEGITWYPQTINASWTARYGQMASTLSNGDIVLTGGKHIPTDMELNDTWISSNQGETWKIQNKSSGWIARHVHTQVTLPDDSIVIIGGYSNGNRGLSDVWRSTDAGATWIQQNASSGMLWGEEATAVVSLNGNIVLMGGCPTDTSDSNSVWQSADKGVTWIRLSDARWSARYAGVSVLSSDGDIITMGGTNTKTEYLNDVWKFKPIYCRFDTPLKVSIDVLIREFSLFSRYKNFNLLLPH